MTPTPSVVCAGLGFEWPDGTVALHDLDVGFAPGRSGLVGRNGSGKTTLLRLLGGDLVPTRGTVTVTGDVGHLPQALPLDTARTVADLLGVARRRAALQAIEAGSTDPAHFAEVGDDWDVDARATEALARFGLLDGAADALDRPIGTLSGGEAVLTGMAGLLLRRPAITLLDEPTNNLDLDSVGRLTDALRLPRRPDHRQPRPAVPRRPRHHPDVGGRRRRPAGGRAAVITTGRGARG